MSNDPFERAVAKEATLASRMRRFEDPRRFIGLAFLVLTGMFVGWTGLVVAHWLVFPEPRWLAVLHTVALGLGWLYLIGTRIFMAILARVRPDYFEDS